MKKCVIVIDSELNTGLIANTSAVLALTVGRRLEEIVGDDTLDASGVSHIGITNIPIPILKASSEWLLQTRLKLTNLEYSDLLVVDFSDAAQTTKNYEDYRSKISNLETEKMKYLGIAIFGNHKKVSRLTGNLSLLR